MHIPIYRTINDLHLAAGTGLKSVYDSFFIHRFEDISPDTRLELPPYRNSFFSIHLFLPLAGSGFTGRINAAEHRVDQALITFTSPGQILQWKRSGPLSGFCIQFTHQFIQLNDRVRRTVDEFPFFNYNSFPPLALEASRRQTVVEVCEKILSEQARGEPFSLSILRGYTDILLYLAKRLYLLQAAPVEVNMKPAPTRAYKITHDFQKLIWQHLSSKKTIEEYAGMLNLSPKHLSETIKQATGKNASQLIQEALLQESIYLLEQTDLTVAEITFELGFENQSNFAKFFRKHTGANPTEYRTSRISNPN
jgi:AraC family transcriptional regulator, transcriptional activator of pobA